MQRPQLHWEKGNMWHERKEMTRGTTWHDTTTLTFLISQPHSDTGLQVSVVRQKVKEGRSWQRTPTEKPGCTHWMKSFGNEFCVSHIFLLNSHNALFYTIFSFSSSPQTELKLYSLACCGTSAFPFLLRSDNCSRNELSTMSTVLSYIPTHSLGVPGCQHLCLKNRRESLVKE